MQETAVRVLAEIQPSCSVVRRRSYAGPSSRDASSSTTAVRGCSSGPACSISSTAAFVSLALSIAASCSVCSSRGVGICERESGWPPSAVAAASMIALASAADVLPWQSALRWVRCSACRANSCRAGRVQRADAMKSTYSSMCHRVISRRCDAAYLPCP
eukprot:3029064-Prymnesium_polylepis.2